MLPIEVGEVFLQRHYFAEAQNYEALQVDLDLIKQVREDAIIMTKACKQPMTRHFNSKPDPWQFKEGELVWRACSKAQKPSSDGKLVANWEGPFRLRYNLKNGAYKLDELSGEVILRT